MGLTEHSGEAGETQQIVAVVRQVGISKAVMSSRQEQVLEL